MKSRTVITKSEDETIAFGRELGRELKGGVVLLIGNLGAGKTTLVKGIVEGQNAGGMDEVSSPTFTLIQQYGDVFHIDLYRLEEDREVETLGLDDLYACGSLVLMEWAERFPMLLPKQRVEIRLALLGDDEREIAVVVVG